VPFLRRRRGWDLGHGRAEGQDERDDGLAHELKCTLEAVS
jgi:hypothetical protein